MKYKILLIFSIVILLLTGCDVETEILWEEKSPDNKNNAILYRKNAGATTAYGYHVDIIRERKIFKDIEVNVFRGSHLNHIQLEWKNKNKLFIYIMGTNPTIYFQEEEIELGNDIIEIKYNIYEE